MSKGAATVTYTWVENGEHRASCPLEQISSDERLKNLGGGNYWKELLDRIRDIRSSEKVMYRQVLDLYATSVDYNPKSSESIGDVKYGEEN